MPKRKIKLVERKLGREKALGQFLPESKVIEIEPRQTEKEILSVTIHEAFHYVYPQFTEEEVLRVEKKFADILWKAGYRRVKGLCPSEKSDKS